MKKSLKKILAFTMAAAMAAGLAACGSSASTSPSAGGSGSAPAVSDEPIKISMYYADNPTLPYMDSWLAVQETAKIAGVDLTVEAIPSTDYNTKVSLALNTGENCPDVILYQDTKGENSSLALNGAIVPISDYPEWTPNFNAMVEKLGAVSAKNMRVIESGQDFYIGDLDISPFPLPHDAADPCGYAFTCGRLRAAIATDIGCLREGWLKAVSGCELVLLESNYDPGMLKAGRYPYALKTRILGTKGHLSNEDAGRAACRLVESGVRSLILGHLSRENNFPELALETVRLALTEAGVKVGTDAELTVASRDHASGMFAVRDGFDLIRRA